VSPSWGFDSDSGSSPVPPHSGGPERKRNGYEARHGSWPAWKIAGPTEEERSDEALMERVRDGHRDSLRILLERYWSSLVGYAAGFVGGRDPAKDVVQDTFIRVWTKREEWSSGGSVSAYLYRIVRNLSLNARRDRSTARRHDDLCGVTRAREDPPRRPDEALEAASLRAEVEAAIEALPERRREVFVLSRFHGLTHREIAETMEISPQTVSNQMTAALAELRRTLCHHLRGR